MASRLYNHISQRRQLGVRVNYAHPLLRNCIGLWLLNESGGGSRNLLSPYDRPGYSLYTANNWGSNNYWKASPYGICPNYGLAASFGALSSTVENRLITLTTFSNISALTFYSMAAGQNRDSSVGFMDTRNGGGTLYELVGNRTNTNTVLSKFFTPNGSVQGVTNLYNIPSWIPIHVAGTQDPTANKFYIYLNGIQEGSATPGATSPTPNEIDVAGCIDGAFNAVGMHLCNAIWNRTLSQYELQWLAQEPLDFILPPLYRKFFVIAVISLSLTVSDDQSGNWADSVVVANNPAQDFGVVTSDTLQLQDGLEYIGGDPDFQIVAGDSLNIKDSDFEVISFEEPFSDTLSLSDTFNFTLGYPINAFDSMQFNWADAASLALVGALTVTVSDDQSPNWQDALVVNLGSVLITITLSDSLTILTDALVVNLGLRRAVSDQIQLADDYKFLFAHFLAVADSLNLSDSAATAMDTAGGAFADTLSLSDSVAIQLFADLTINVSDTLALSDAAAFTLTGVANDPANLDYLRRYLNDK